MLYTLLILGAAQGIFLALVLFAKRVNSSANTLLALAMLSFSAFLLVTVYYGRSYYVTFPHLIGTGQPLVFLFGPILFLYARMISTAQPFKRIWLLHFLPYLLHTLYLVPFMLQDGASKIAFVDQLSRNEVPLDMRVIDNLRYVHGIIYVALTIRLLRQHRARLEDRFSSLERINLNWLRNLTFGIVIVWSIATIQYGLQQFGVQPTGVVELTPLAVSVFVYAIGYLGLRHSATFGDSIIPVGANGVDARPPTLPLSVRDSESGNEQGSRDPGTAARYERSGLTPERADAYLESLLQMMEEEKLFVRSNLTLQELSDELSISSHNLSEVINTRLGKTFFDFVNELRIEEVKRRLADPQHDHLTILSLAQDSGFSSKSAFNTIFKKTTDMTPSEYRRREKRNEQ